MQQYKTCLHLPQGFRRLVLPQFAQLLSLVEAMFPMSFVINEVSESNIESSKCAQEALNEHMVVLHSGL